MIVRTILVVMLAGVILFSGTASASIFKEFDRMNDNIENISDSVRDIEQCFQSLNESMQKMISTFILMYYSTKASIEPEIDILNGHLSDLNDYVKNFSSSTIEMEESISEVKELKGMAIAFIFGCISMAVIFVVMFSISMVVIVKKMNSNSKKK